MVDRKMNRIRNIKPNKLKLEIDWPLQFPISDFTVGHHNYNIFTSASKKRNQRRRLIVSLPPSSAKFKKPHPGSGLATAKGLTENLTTEVALTTSAVTVEIEPDRTWLPLQLKSK